MTHIFKSAPKSALMACMMGLLLSQTACSQAGRLETPAQSTQQNPAQFQVNYVDAKGAQAMLASKPDTVILDIRTPEETDTGYIDGAVFADFYDEGFAQHLSKMDRDTPYIVHCRSGGRSTKALTTLEELGFTNITHMDGGILGWNEAKLPLKQP